MRIFLAGNLQCCMLGKNTLLSTDFGKKVLVDINKYFQFISKLTWFIFLPS